MPTGPEVVERFKGTGTGIGAFLDVAAAARLDNEVRLLLSDGEGDFFASVKVSVPASPRAIAVGDLNEDGVDDLAVAHAGANGRLIVLLSDI